MTEVNIFIDDFAITQYEIDFLLGNLQLIDSTLNTRIFVRGRNADGVPVGSRYLTMELLSVENNAILLAFQPALVRFKTMLEAAGLTEWIPPPEVELPPP